MKTQVHKISSLQAIQSYCSKKFILIILLSFSTLVANAQGFPHIISPTNGTVINNRCDLQFCIADTNTNPQMNYSLTDASQNRISSFYVINNTVCSYALGSVNIQTGTHTFYLWKNLIWTSPVIVDSVTLTFADSIVPPCSLLHIADSGGVVTVTNYLNVPIYASLGNWSSPNNIYVNNDSLMPGTSISLSTNGLANGTHTIYAVAKLYYCTQGSDSCTIPYTITINNGGCNASFSSYDTINNEVRFDQTVTGVTLNTMFNWNFGDGTYGIGPSIQHAYTTNGTYLVTLSIGDSTTNCFSQYTDTITVTNALTTSLKNTTSITQLTIYPNPNNGTFSIATKANGTYSIVNELGQTIQLFTTINNVATVSGLASGMYFLIGTNGNELTHQKIVVTQ